MSIEERGIPVARGQDRAAPAATAEQHAEEEHEFESSDFDSSTLSSSSTSLNTSIYQHAFENGRRVSWTAWRGEKCADSG